MSVQIQTITRTRGDTYPFTVTFRDSAGAVIDLTGASFILTVNEEEDPDADELAEFSLIGVVAAPLTGVVEFTLSESDADHVGRFFYDIQMTDVQGYIRTMMRGPFEMQQDITKNTLGFWTAEGASAVDGSDGVFFLPTHVNDTWEYAVQDGVPVLRIGFADADQGDFRGLMLTEFPALDFSRDMRISGRFYFDESYISVMTVNWSRYELASAVTINLTVENEPGYRSVSLGAQMPDPVTQVPTWGTSSSAAQPWTSPDWLWWVFEWNATTKTWTGRAFQGVDDGVPLVTRAIDYPDFPPVPFYVGLKTFAAVGNAEVAWIRLEFLS